MKKQYSERKYEATKTEIRFEELLKANGFNILGVREYNERTDYLIEKSGIKCEYPVYALDNKAKRGDNCYNLFNEYYDLKRKNKWELRYITKTKNATIGNGRKKTQRTSLLDLNETTIYGLWLMN